MPRLIIALLKWGGMALAVIGVVALAYVEWYLPGSAGAAPKPTTAPVTLYIVLLVIGVIAAIAGFALARPKE